jgi:excisionase family DNA binding protein
LDFQVQPRPLLAAPRYGEFTAHRTLASHSGGHVSHDRECPMSEPRAFTIPETAERLRASERTVRRLIAADHLRAVRLGRRVVVPQQALIDLLEGREDDTLPGSA